MSTDLVTDIKNFHWLLQQFATSTVGVLEATAVSSDGFLLASSAGAGRENSEQLAAVTAGLASLTRGAAEMFGMTAVEQVLVEMTGGHMFVSTISDGSALAVLCDKRADLGMIGYETTLLVDRVGKVLSPELVDQLKNKLAA